MIASSNFNRLQASNNFANCICSRSIVASPFNVSFSPAESILTLLITSKRVSSFTLAELNFSNRKS